MTQGIYAGFNLVTNFIETEFIEERLYITQYILDVAGYNFLFGNLGEPIDKKDLPWHLGPSDINDLHYIKVQNGLDKFIFSYMEDCNIIFLEYSYTDGLEYIRAELPSYSVL